MSEERPKGTFATITTDLKGTTARVFIPEPDKTQKTPVVGFVEDQPKKSDIPFSIPDQPIESRQPRARKKSPLDVDLNQNFDLFIQEGNVFNIRKKSRKLQKFIPQAPDVGLDSSFNADDFLPSSIKTGNKIVKRFFDF